MQESCIGCYRIRRSVAVVSTRGGSWCSNHVAAGEEFMLLLTQVMLFMSAVAVGTGYVVYKRCCCWHRLCCV